MAYGQGQPPAEAPPATAAGASFARQVSEFRLPNGLRFVIAERHEAPLISFHVYVRAGTVNLPAGQSGMGRLLDRLAWSGTESVGTRDWTAEKKALDALEETYDRLQAERNKGPQTDDVKATSLEVEVRQAAEKARAFAKPDEYRQVLTDQGATGLTATVGMDAIQYGCTLPSNRAELWFSMESQRLSRPVLRGFYAERDNLVQERFNRPAEARIMEVLLPEAFWAHPYRNPPIGWAGDLENLRTADLRAFLDRYFVPGNLTIGIAGDIAPAEVRRLADKFFSGPAWSARPVPAAIATQDPPQSAPRFAISYSATTPIVAVAYRRPNMLDRDDNVFDVIHAILAGSKGWLAQSLTEEKGIATSVRLQASFPGNRYPTLFAILVQPAPGKPAEQVSAAVQAVLDRLRSQALDDATLARGKAQVRAAILGALEQNASTATLLAAGTAELGDWHEALHELDRVSAIDAAAVQRVAAKYFVPEHRIVAYSGSEVQPAAGGGK